MCRTSRYSREITALFELKDIPNQSENSSSSSDYEDNTINELESDCNSPHPPSSYCPLWASLPSRICPQKAPRQVEVPPTAYKAWLVLLNSRCGIPSSFPPLGAQCLAGTPARVHGSDTIVTAHTRYRGIVRFGHLCPHGFVPKSRFDRLRFPPRLKRRGLLPSTPDVGYHHPSPL